jgi:hypothetical protein
MAGIGLVVLGWLVALEVALLESSDWLLAIVILVLMGWVPAFLFWLATRLRETAED